MLRIFNQANLFKERIAIESDDKEFSYSDLMHKSDLIASFLLSDKNDLNEEKITPLIDLIYERVDNLSLSLETQIPEILTSIDVLVKDLNKLVKSADKLLDEGIYVIGFSFPVVPKEQARIRVQISAAHSLEDLDKAISAFTKVGKELGVLGNN